MSSFRGNTLPPASHWLTNPASWRGPTQSRRPAQELDADGVVEGIEERSVDEDQGGEHVEAGPGYSSFTDLLNSHDDVVEGPLDSQWHGNSFSGIGSINDAPTYNQHDPARYQQTEQYYVPNFGQHNRDISTEAKGKQRATYPSLTEGLPQVFNEEDREESPEEGFEPYQMIDGVPCPIGQSLLPADRDTAGPSSITRHHPREGEVRPIQAEEILAEPEPSITKGIDKRSRGQVRTTKNGQLQQREGVGHDWADAVRIEDIRDELIALSRQWGQYNIPPEGGFGNNVTCYCRGQENWGPERSQRPSILFRFFKERVQPGEKPHPWYHGDSRVISPDNHHMTFFADCPMTISSEVHPFRLEAWRRLNPGLTNTDILYRIPPRYQERSRGSLKMVERYGLTGLTNKIWRWRPGAFVIPWEQRGSGGRVLRRFLLEKMDKRSKQENNTRHLRDLRPDELRDFKALLEANKIKQNKIKTQKREIERRKKAGQRVSDLEIEEDSGTEPDISNDEQDDTLRFTEPVGKEMKSQSRVGNEATRRDVSNPISGKRRREEDEQDDLLIDSHPSKRRILTKPSVSRIQVVGPPITKAELPRYHSNARSQGISAQLTGHEHGTSTIRSPSLPQTREPSTSNLGKRRRERVEQDDLDEEDLPAPKKSRHIIYIPGTTRPGTQSRRSVGSKKPSISRNSSPKQPVKQRTGHPEIVISTIMTFDPFAALDYYDPPTSDAFQSACPKPTQKVIIKPTSTGSEGAGVTIPQEDSVPASWASLPGFDDPRIFQPDEGRFGLDQTPDDPDEAWRSSSESPSQQESPTKRAHDALQQTMQETDLQSSNYQSPSEHRYRLPPRRPEDASQQLVGSSTVQSSDPVPPAVTQAEHVIGNASSPPSPAEKPRYYYRSKRPETQADQQQIDHAMNHSRIYYMRALGQNAPMTYPRTYSFAEQYAGLAAAYQQHCDGNINLDPTLHEVIGDWSSGFDDWQCNWDILGGQFGRCPICKR